MQRCHHPDAGAVRALIAQALAAQGNALWQRRLDGVLLVAEGHACADVARWFGLCPRTVQRWVRDADRLGLAPQGHAHAGGRAPALDRGLMQTLQQDLQARPSDLGYAELRWSGKRLALHLQRRYGVLLGVRSCQRLIARCRAR